MATKVGRTKATKGNYLTPAQLIANARKRFGDDIIITGKQLKEQVITRTSTGSLALDDAFGGGLPLNKWIEIVGDPSSGKTTLCYKTIATAQALDPDYFVLWIASEPFVVEWAEAAGCDLDRIYVFDSNIMEDCYETVIEWLDNRGCDCVVIDSLPAMVPRDEDDGTMVDWNVGLAARLNGKFFRKSRPAQKRSVKADDDDRDCLLLVVNQWREKIGVTHGDPRTTPGGRAKEYHYGMKIDIRRDDWIEVDKVRVGITMAVRTTKNKCGPVQRLAVVDFYYDKVGQFSPGQFDVAKDIVNVAISRQVIARGTPRYSFQGRGWGKREDLDRDVLAERELRDDLRAAVLRVSTGLVTPSEAPTEPEPPKLAPAATRRAPAKPAAKAPAAKKATAPATKKIIRRK